jgi:putative membrane protein
VDTETPHRRPSGREWPDPTRRTYLANERTYLAWWRSGLTALAVGVGVGRLLPRLGHGDEVVSAVAGIGFVLLGVFFVLYGTHRERRVREALERNDFSHPDPRVLTGLAVASIALGALTIVLVARA